MKAKKYQEHSEDWAVAARCATSAISMPQMCAASMEMPCLDTSRAHTLTGRTGRSTCLRRRRRRHTREVASGRTEVVAASSCVAEHASRTWWALQPPLPRSDHRCERRGRRAQVRLDSPFISERRHRQHRQQHLCGPGRRSHQQAALSRRVSAHEGRWDELRLRLAAAAAAAAGSCPRGTAATAGWL